MSNSLLPPGTNQGCLAALLLVSAWYTAVPARADEIKPKPIQELKCDRPTAIAFSPDGSVVVAAGNAPAKNGERVTTGILEIWDTRTWELLHTLENPSLIRCIRFSPDGTKLGVGGSGLDGKIVLWDASTWQIDNTLTATDNLFSFSFSPDGNRLAVAKPNRMEIWTLPSGRVLRASPTTTDTMAAVVFSPDGSRVASGGRNLELYNANTGSRPRTLATLPAGQAVLDIAYSRDGSLLAAGLTDGTVQIRDGATGTLKQTLKTPQNDQMIFSVAFSPDGDVLASRAMKRLSQFTRPELVIHMLLGTDTTLWDLSSGKILHTLPGLLCSPDESRSVAFSEDGRLVATGN